MRVAVVGAGLAGLAAARELRATGHEPVVFEKSRGLGGRLAARRVAGTVLDHGSRLVAAPPGTALAALIDELGADDRVDLTDGVGFASGATRLAKLMAGDLDVRLGVRLAALRAAGGGFEPGDEQGNTHGTVDAVVITAPAPQAADLLERSPEAGERVAALRALDYAPAVMVLLGLRLGGDPGWEVLRDVGDPIGEVRRDAVKGRPAIDGVEPVVVRLDEAASAALLDASDEEALGRTLPALAARLGAAAEPEWTQVKRWRYAVPAGRAEAGAVNPPGARILIAGDTITGAGFGSHDAHRVFDDGVRAARRVTA